MTTIIPPFLGIPFPPAPPALPDGPPALPAPPVAPLPPVNHPEPGEKPSAPISLTDLTVLYFYGPGDSSGDTPGEPVVYRVDLTDGQVTAVSEPPPLFATAFEGLFATELTMAPWQPVFGVPIPRPVNNLGDPPLIFTLIQGTDGPDALEGSPDNNALFGLGGDDLIQVGEGQNLAFGGTGNNQLIGGPGNDILFGGPGDDILVAGDGDDILLGGPGDDILYGGAGANILVGGPGADIFRLGTPGAYPGGDNPPLVQPDRVVDFNPDEGDRLDLSPLATQPAFADHSLETWVSFEQVGNNTHLIVTTPQGHRVTEAILLDTLAEVILPAVEFSA
jgi:hypothetical protein